MMKANTRHAVFLPLLLLTFLLWMFYRSVFNFSVLFDETIGKAVFFALPVLLYVSLSGNKKILQSFAFTRLPQGLLLGVAIGGLLGFVGALLASLMHGGTVVNLPYYLATWFWWEFFLAIMTGFFETLFFYSFVMTVTLEKFKSWSLFRQVNLVASIFLLFHLPNIFLRFEIGSALWQVLLLYAFAYAQALLFYKRQNAYLLLMTQAIWGMVLLIHF